MPCAHKRTREPAARVGLRAVRRRVEFVGEGADDAEDGALDRLGQRLPGALRTAAHRGRQRTRVQFGQCMHVLGHPMEELRQDGAGIAARTIDRVIADTAEQIAGMLAGLAERAVQHAAERRGEIVAGIAIGDREHVDAVQSIPGRNDPTGPGDQRQAQGGGGQGTVVGRGHGKSLPQARAPPCCAAAAHAGFPPVRRRGARFRRKALEDPCPPAPIRL